MYAAGQNNALQVAALVSGRGAQRMTYRPKARPEPRWEPPSGVSALERTQRSLLACQRLQAPPEVQSKPRQPIRQEQLNVKRH